MPFTENTLQDRPSSNSSRYSSSCKTRSSVIYLVPVRYVRYGLLSLFILLTSRVFQYFPGMSIIKDLWVVLLAGALVLPYLVGKARIGWLFLSFELYILGMIALVPILSGVAAYMAFGQPVFYGVLAQRNMILGIGALLMIYACQRRYISSSDIENTLLLLAWGTLLLYVGINVLFQPQQFASYGEGFVSPANKYEKAAFKFNSIFIVYGFFYYAFLGFRRKRSQEYLSSMVFLIYLVIMDGGRSLLVSVLLSFSYFIFRWGSIWRLMLLLPKVLVFSFAALGIVVVSNSEYLTYLSARFIDAFTVLFSGEQTRDNSANARLLETMIAIPYILKHWLIGNGDLSNQWHGGYEGVLRTYFYPSDIGIIGVIFMYGIVGIALFSMQYVFVRQYAGRMPNKYQNPLLDSTYGFLLYVAMHSIVTGMYVYYFETSILFVAVIVCIYLENNWVSESSINRHRDDR